MNWLWLLGIKPRLGFRSANPSKKRRLMKQIRGRVRAKALGQQHIHPTLPLLQELDDAQLCTLLQFRNLLMQYYDLPYEPSGNSSLSVMVSYLPHVIKRGEYLAVFGCSPNQRMVSMVCLVTCARVPTTTANHVYS